MQMPEAQLAQMAEAQMAAESEAPPLPHRLLANSAAVAGTLASATPALATPASAAPASAAPATAAPASVAPAAAASASTPPPPPPGTPPPWACVSVVPPPPLELPLCAVEAAEAAPASSDGPAASANSGAPAATANSGAQTDLPKQYSTLEWARWNALKMHTHHRGSALEGVWDRKADAGKERARKHQEDPRRQDSSTYVRSTYLRTYIRTYVRT